MHKPVQTAGAPGPSLADGQPLSREQLLSEGLEAKFLRYVQVDSPSSDDGDGVPSTPEQWAMARLLEEELRALGLEEVEVDEHGIVTATLPAAGARPDSPTIGLLAHYDTFPGTPGKGVRPIVHRNYGGGEIRLPAGPVLRPADHPELLACVGHDLVTSDGSTLLGADDKAGVGDIMEALCRLIADPSRRRCRIRVAFTPDEETGKGIGYLDPRRFGAHAAYTLDGGRLGELEGENFNAQNLRVVIRGRSAHTGTARGVMINALQLAAELITSIPAGMRPETTDGRLGFIHVDAAEGNVEEIRLKLLLRDFTDEGLAQKAAIVKGILKGLEQRYPGAQTRIELLRGYRNMKAALDREPRAMEFARRAMRDLNIEPLERGIRGGTDGARLSEVGLPTPNLFAGGMNFHSRTEWADLAWMEKAVQVLLRLVELWASAGEGSGESSA